MSIFSFLKRKKGGELEIPPPPPIEAVKAGAPQLVPKENIPPPPKMEIPAMPSSDNKIMPEPEKKEDFPEFPLFPEPEKKQDYSYKFEPIKHESDVVHPMAQQRPVEIREILKETKIPQEAPRRIDKPLPQKDALKKVSEEKHFLKEPIFVKTNQYQNMLDNINQIKNKIKECDFISESLNDIKNKKDNVFNKWRSNLEDMQRKVSLVEKSLFEVSK